MHWKIVYVKLDLTDAASAFLLIYSLCNRIDAFQLLNIDDEWYMAITSNRESRMIDRSLRIITRYDIISKRYRILFLRCYDLKNTISRSVKTYRLNGKMIIIVFS